MTNGERLENVASEPMYTVLEKHKLLKTLVQSNSLSKII